MWVCYALHNLSNETATNLKEAVNLQRREYGVMLHEADLASNDYRYMSEWEHLPERSAKYESAIDICDQYIEDKITIDILINKLGELNLLDIRGDFYNLLPEHLKQICDSWSKNS